MSERDDMVLIGIITGAHGIKGEVRLKSFAAEPSAIADYGPLATSNGEAVEIDRLRPQKEGFIPSLKGVINRAKAKPLKGTEWFGRRIRSPAPRRHEVDAHDPI